MSKPSYVQLELLTEFLEGHKQLAAGYLRTADARRKAKQLWANIAVRPNSLEGTRRTGPGWHKYWTDKKSYLKRLVSGRTPSTQRPGDGTDAPPSLSELDTRMVALLGHNYMEVSQRHTAVAHPCHSRLPTTQDLLAALRPWRRHLSVVEHERKFLRNMAQQRISIEQELLSLDKERLTIERQRLTLAEGCLQDISTSMRTIGEALIALAKK